jgi:hypothetical protein
MNVIIKRKLNFVQSRDSSDISLCVHGYIRDHDCTIIVILSAEMENHVRNSLYSIGITGEFKQWGQDTTDFVDSMRFTRSGCVSRHVFSDEVGGHNLWYLRRTVGEGHATPLDFTTREVARESFLWRVRSLPLLVQITFRTLNLFRGRGCRVRARIRRWNFCLAFSYRLFSFDIAHFRARARYAPNAS